MTKVFYRSGTVTRFGKKKGTVGHTFWGVEEKRNRKKNKFAKFREPR